MMATFEQMFFEHQVDVAFAGHVHVCALPLPPPPQ